MTANTDASAVWFITGCSTGLGRALARRVLQRGYRCVVTARDPSQIEDIAAAYPKSALALALDVTDRTQLQGAIGKAKAEFGCIDVLVNNAGYGYLAAVEEGDEQDVRAMFETNFFGLVAVTKGVLPLMRAKGSGHIINISSIGGLVGNPSSGYYNASKFAVEGLSEAMAKEVDSLGIRVTLIEPGPFRTDFQGRSIRVVRQPIAAYADTAAARRADLKQSSGKQAGDPERAADAIIKVVQSDSPPLHLVLAKNGIVRARDKFTEFLRSIGEWEAVTVSADFPEQ
jgi:NAD(P)-dependent dehydrogenase (short-subunit alcohol dehydrogenase family)